MSDQPASNSGPARSADREPAQRGRDDVDTEAMGDDPEREGGLISNTGDDTGEGEAPTG